LEASETKKTILRHLEVLLEGPDLVDDLASRLVHPLASPGAHPVVQLIPDEGYKTFLFMTDAPDK
jgi:hypothetical protein